MSVLSLERLYGTFREGIVQFVYDEVDGTTAETAAHDTRTGDAALFGDVIEEIQFFAAHFVLFTQSFVRAVHLTAYFLVVTLNECVADSQYTVFLSENEGSALDIFCRTSSLHCFEIFPRAITQRLYLTIGMEGLDGLGDVLAGTAAVVIRESASSCFTHELTNTRR